MTRGHPSSVSVSDHAVRDDQIPLVVVFDHACANEQALHELCLRPSRVIGRVMSQIVSTEPLTS